MEVRTDATLVVRAPRRMPLREIHRFISSHEEWIERKTAEAIHRPQPPLKEFREGEGFLVTGKTCHLHIVSNATRDVDFDGRLVLSAKAVPCAREAITRWYRKQARILFTARVQHFAEVMRCQPVSIRITSPRRRWGSCGVYNSLNFNWRLIMAPPEIIDYVVVHELAHVRYKHHGPDFWDVVSKFHPDHRQAKRWLKDNGHLLEF